MIPLKRHELFLEVPKDTEDGFNICQIVWAKKVFDSIYLLSLAFKDEEGYTLWYAEPKKEGGFELLACAFYDSLTTLMIKQKEREETYESR